jgi:pimeloyl-ACP methyl ester carboxylesterase
MYAERVAGLALVASHVAADASGANASGAIAEQQKLAAGRTALADALERAGTMEPAIESYLPRYFAPAVYADRPELVEHGRAVMARQSPRGCAQLVRGMAQRLDSHDLLEDVTVPSLVIAGAEDYYLKPDSLRETARRMNDATFVELAGVGHLPMTEDPAATNAALAAWARQVWM